MGGIHTYTTFLMIQRRNAEGIRKYSWSNEMASGEMVICDGNETNITVMDNAGRLLTPTEAYYILGDFILSSL